MKQQHKQQRQQRQQRQLTIRGVSDEVRRRLESLGKARGQSLNATVLEILEQAFDVDQRRRRLARYATWNADDLQEFEEALAAQRVIDPELWG
jgi:hypothetical protein